MLFFFGHCLENVSFIKSNDQKACPDMLLQGASFMYQSFRSLISLGDHGYVSQELE